MDERMRPLLRGWVHAATVPFTILALLVLWRGVRHLPPLERVPAAAYGLSLGLLFTTSATYHLPLGWSDRARARLMRLDGSATVLLIVGTFVPVASYVLEGAWRRWSLAGAACAAVIGVVLAASRLTPSPALSAAMYAGLGWAVVVPMTRIAAALPWQGSALIVLGGVLYSVGALVFARRWLDLAPQRFGFHEVFHVFVTLAAAVHFIAVWRFVLPAA